MLPTQLVKFRKAGVWYLGVLFKRVFGDVDINMVNMVDMVAAA